MSAATRPHSGQSYAEIVPKGFQVPGEWRIAISSSAATRRTSSDRFVLALPIVTVLAILDTIDSQP
jgi:hypothetical protein